MRQLRVDLKEVKSSFEIGCGWSQSWVQADIRGMPIVLDEMSPASVVLALCPRKSSTITLNISVAVHIPLKWKQPRKSRF